MSDHSRNKLPTAPLVEYLRVVYPMNEADTPDQWAEPKWFAFLTHTNHATMRRWMVEGATTYWWHLDLACAMLGIHPALVYEEAWWDAARKDLEQTLRAVARGRYSAEQFGFVMAERREAEGISLRDLGKELDVDYTILQRIERGLMLPSHKIQRRLMTWVRKETT